MSNLILLPSLSVVDAVVDAIAVVGIVLLMNMLLPLSLLNNTAGVHLMLLVLLMVMSSFMLLLSDVAIADFDANAVDFTAGEINYTSADVEGVVGVANAAVGKLLLLLFVQLVILLVLLLLITVASFAAAAAAADADATSGWQESKALRELSLR